MATYDLTKTIGTYDNIKVKKDGTLHEVESIFIKLNNEVIEMDGEMFYKYRGRLIT